MNQTTNDNQSKPVQIPYNGEPLQDDEILAPQFISREYADLIEAQGVRTWYRAGIPYLVMFIPVKIGQEQIAMMAFNADVNDFIDSVLGKNRYSRCLIDLQNEKQKPCPKEVNGKYNSCTGCPNRGKLPKENRNPQSLDDLEEKHQPTGSMYSTDNCFMFESLLGDLLEDFSEKCPRYADIVRLGYSGMSRKDIIEQLPVQKSQGYQLFKECRKAIEDYLKD